MRTQVLRASSATAVKIGVSRQVVIPKRFHDQLGLNSGDYLEVAMDGDRLILTPKALVDKRIAEGLEDFKKGRTLGPFKNVRAAMRALRAKR